MERLVFKQQIPADIQEVWDFFSSPKNLNEITPNDMHFEILTPDLDKMYAGQLIHYRIKPLLQIPMQWVTEITHVIERKYFVDNQIIGPYRLWHHEHHFEPNEHGVLMTDILHYQAPFGFLGGILNQLFIRKKIKEIFTFREQFIKQKFK